MANFLSDLRTMYHIVTAAGKICYVTTTQPRSFPNDDLLQQLKTGRDSVLMEFGPFALNFYDQLVIPNTLHFNPALMFAQPPDTIHPNNAGHSLLFNVVKNNILLTLTPLPLLLTSFNATIDGGAADIHWTTVDEQGQTSFEVQKSADGQSFSGVYTEAGKGSQQGNDYSWTDNELLSGTSYYRLHIVNDGQESYSQIVTLNNKKATGLIGKLYQQSASSLSVELNILQSGPADVEIFTAGGLRISKQTISVTGGSVLASIGLNGLSAGVYFLRVGTAGGEKETRAFTKF
jgi:hypothetical protein